MLSRYICFVYSQLTTHTNKKSLNKSEALRIIRALKSFRPTIEEILSTNAVIVNDLRRHDDLEIAAESKDLRGIWKRCVEEKEGRGDAQSAPRPAPKPVIKPMGSTKLFSAIKGAVPVSSTSSRNSLNEMNKSTPSLSPLNKQPEQVVQVVDEADTITIAQEKAVEFSRGKCCIAVYLMWYFPVDEDLC
jgi:hypothetical protein